MNSEIEFQKCNIALGKPVDGERLIAVAEELQQQVDELQGKLEAIELGNEGTEDELTDVSDKYETLRDAVFDAIVTLSRTRCDAKTRLKLAKALESVVSNLE